MNCGIQPDMHNVADLADMFVLAEILMMVMMLVMVVVVMMMFGLVLTVAIDGALV